MAGSLNRPCAGCGNPLSDLKVSQRKKYCRLCEARVHREQKKSAHDRRVEKLYGLRPGEYQKLYEAQGGKCAVPGCRARGITKALAVEHDHKLGLHNRKAVRGLMCSMHNEWLGLAADNPDVFAFLFNYLKHPPAQEILK